jgi:hypothetical protein
MWWVMLFGLRRRQMSGNDESLTTPPNAP